MNRGAKRPAFDSSDAAADLRSKRVMDGPSFHVHRAEPGPSFLDAQRAESSRQHARALNTQFAGAEPGPSLLDAQRAESTRQHVRALNTQFASWVQLQSQNHPDELWEDGVKDYLCHASHIMEKFKDVVDWLRTNAAKSGGMPTTVSPSEQKNLVAVSDNNKPKLPADINNGFARAGTSASSSRLQNSGSLFSLQSSSTSFSSQSTSFFSSPQSSGSLFGSQSSGSLFGSQSTGASFGTQGSGLFSSSQTPSFLGSQSSTFSKVETSGDIDEEDELEKPSSPSLKKTEEKGIVVVHEVKCKVYVKPDNPADKGWKDIGVGQLSIKCKEGASKATKESNPTIIIRNDVGKILLNALIYPGIKINIQKKTIASIFHTSGGGGNDAGDSNKAMARTYLFRMKSEEETTNLATTIKEYAPSG